MIERPDVPAWVRWRRATPLLVVARDFDVLIECSERDEIMIKIQWMIVAMAVLMVAATAEARGRRYAQPTYSQYYTSPQQYNTATPQYYANPTPSNVVTTNVVAPSTTPVTTTNVVIQTSGVETLPGAVVPANSVVTASSVVAPAAAPAQAAAAPGSAQWKAEQSARLGSVQHLGGGFGGGSFEGNGFGATADQAIRNSCFWGQRTPIEIGVARGANGYYATIFYR